ncbi:hypothetical protein [Spirillospora sp. CA-294931]|uniref:hypothetical protein n=1 Tax=Spirillospora sp. CA-294931 TaxID=3240042 RepID=UPI003D8A63BD
MRRLVAVAITSGALVAGLCATGGTASAATESQAGVVGQSAPAVAQSGTVTAQRAVRFDLRKSGLAATTGYGSYYWGRYGKYRTRVVNAKIRDNKRGKYSCIRIAFYSRKGQNLGREDIFVYNRSGKGTTATKAVQSYRLGYIAMRECEGYVKGRRFIETAKGGWRWYR